MGKKDEYAGRADSEQPLQEKPLRRIVKRKSAEKALEDFLKDYVNSGQLDADLASLPASQRLQAVARLLPYCLPKAKESSDKSKDYASATGNEAIAQFFSRLSRKKT